MVEQVPAEDHELTALVAAQQAELTARYGEQVTSPGLPPGLTCLLACLDGRAVGCVAVGPTGAAADDGVGEVLRMYVDPAARGRAIGRLLLERAESLAARLSCTSLRLTTGTGQPEAVRLYDSAGWRRVPCSGPDEDRTVCFAKQLPGAPPA